MSSAIPRSCEGKAQECGIHSPCKNLACPLTLITLENFSTYKNECGHFWHFICKSVYEHFL